MFSRFIDLLAGTLALSCIYVSPCEARVTGIFILASENPKLKFVLPKIEGIPQSEVLQKLETALQNSPSYRPFQKFFVGNKNVLSPIKQGKIISIAASPNTATQKSLPTLLRSAAADEPLDLAVIANDPSMMSLDDPRKKDLVDAFTRAGASVTVVPFGINALLTNPEDLTEYYSEISKTFPALLAPGGADIDPVFYRQKNTASKNVNFSRDDEELKLIKTYVTQGNGVFYGICRGHQAYVVATGGDLYQDISLEGIPTEIHAPKKSANGEELSSWHEIQLTNKANALYEATGKDHFRVNSRHHQAAKTVSENQGQVIAKEEGRVIEAIEKRDSRGRVKVLTVQFHPEDMFTEDSEKILRWMVKNAKDQSRSKNSSKKGG